MAMLMPPGLVLPGLVPPPSSSTPAVQEAHSTTRTEVLAARTEWRFEAGVSRAYDIRLIRGEAELFGIELAINQTYNFSGSKGAIFTWKGCSLEVTGEAESEYAGQETEYAIESLNIHGMLQSAREDPPHEGPRVLVVGPDHVGKSSLVRTLAAWDVKVGRTPTIVNLDPREGVLAPPGTLTATIVSSQVDVENGFGTSGISGPSGMPLKTPLVYSFPYLSPLEKPEVYKPIITRMALSVTNRLEEDAEAKQGGIIIDSAAALNDPKGNYELLTHIVSEFSINLVLSIGSERLFSDLSRRLSSSSFAEEAIQVLRITKPGGTVERDAAFLKHTRTKQIRQYFFGSSKEPLNPHSHSVGFSELTIFRAKPTSTSEPASTSYGEDDYDDDIPYAASANKKSNAAFEKVEPSLAMTGSLVAIKFCSGSSDEETVRDSAAMGYLYVADVDETRKKVRFLAPHPQRWGDRALLWGSWPEAVADLVT